MKKSKIVSTFLALVLALALAVSLTGCQSRSLEDYLKEPETVKQLDALKSQAESAGQSMDVFAENGNLVYEYSLGDLDLSDDTAKEQLKSAISEAMDASASMFETVASTLQTELKDENISVVVRYKSGDGEVLYENSYK